MQKFKPTVLETYFVDVKVVGHWYERYQVEAESEDDARDRYIDGDHIETYEHCQNDAEVVEVEKYWYD